MVSQPTIHARIVLALAALTMSLGCSLSGGSLEARRGGPGGEDEATPGATPSTGGATGATPGGGPSTPAPIDGAAFEIAGDSVQLLPYAVRLNKLAGVAGVPTSDAMFAKVKESRLELGDYDYGQGVSPDLSWTARRMSTWVRAILPVCESQAMKTRFPSFGDALDAFTRAAYGRPATAEDAAALSELSAAGLAPDVAYRTTCLALLSAAEFVAQ